MFTHLFRAATLAKLAIAASLVAGAYGTGALDLPETRPLTASVHAEKTHETPEASTSPQDSTHAATTTKTPEPTKAEPTRTPEATTPFESLLKECVRRYTQHLDGAKDVCTAAIAKSGLDVDAFWAKYRSLFVIETKPTPATPPTTATLEALLKECVARYARAASNTKEACDAAIRASGLEAKDFWAKYGSLMVPPTRPTTSPKPVATPQPTLSPECMAKYEAAKAAKGGPADAFQALLRAYYAACYPTAKL